MSDIRQDDAHFTWKARLFLPPHTLPPSHKWRIALTLSNYPSLSSTTLTNDPTSPFKNDQFPSTPSWPDPSTLTSPHYGKWGIPFTIITHLWLHGSLFYVVKRKAKREEIQGRDKHVTRFFPQIQIIIQLLNIHPNYYIYLIHHLFTASPACTPRVGISILYSAPENTVWSLHLLLSAQPCARLKATTARFLEILQFLHHLLQHISHREVKHTHHTFISLYSSLKMLMGDGWRGWSAMIDKIHGATHFT